jgi:hypothetical protein
MKSRKTKRTTIVRFEIKSHISIVEFPHETAYSVPIPEPDPLSDRNPEVIMRTIAFKIVKAAIFEHQMMHFLFQFPILNY